MANYIHGTPGWPEFQWDINYLSERLTTVRYRQGRLIGHMEALGFSQRSEALLLTLTDDVITSSAIEGEILDRGQVRSSVARRLGLETGALELDTGEADLRDALAETIRRLDGVLRPRDAAIGLHGRRHVERDVDAKLAFLFIPFRKRGGCEFQTTKMLSASIRFFIHEFEANGKGIQCCCC